jgi:hypothetical protein
MDKDKTIEILTKLVIARNEHLEYCIDGQMVQQMEIPNILKEMKESAQAIQYLKENLK